MPWLHRYIGNPLLSGFLNLLFRTGVDDAHCGMRAFRRDVLPRLDLRTTGMEFASEMVIRAAKEHLEVRQFPIEYHPREGESKLSSFRDGWRHLRFLLLHSPNHLFIFPGALMAGIGALVELSWSSPTWGSSGAHGTSTRSSPGRCWRSWARRSWRWESAPMPTRPTSWPSETAGLTGCARATRSSTGWSSAAALLVAGAAVGVYIVIRWIEHGFGRLSEENLAVLAATLIIVGIQIFFSSFLLSILGLRRRDRSSLP